MAVRERGYNSDWCFLSGMVTNAQDGVAEERYFLVPRGQVTIVPTWDAIGLHGSGSDDIKVEELFVPEHMTLPIDCLKGGETPGNRLHPAPLYRSPCYMWFGILLASASLGMAEGMLTDYVEEAKRRVALMTGQETRSLMSQHIKVAEAVAAVEGPLARCSMPRAATLCPCWILVRYLTTSSARAIDAWPRMLENWRLRPPTRFGTPKEVAAYI